MTRRILIVEDDPTVSALLADVLADEGYTTMTAPTADAALGMVASVRPDLILCDLVLPDRDGVAFYERLLRLPSPPPVIFLTALHATEAELRLRTQAPNRPLLAKPVNRTQLVALVDTHVDRTR